jgi:hypothetical protein
MSLPNIIINIHEERRDIKIELPKDVELLERSLAILTEYSGFKSEDIDALTYNYPETISLELLNKHGFKELFKKLNREFGDWHYRKCNMTNAKEIYQEQDKIKEKQALNIKEWKQNAKSVLENIKIKNINYIILNIISSIPDEQKAVIVDDVQQQLINIPIIKYYSHRKSVNTIVELMFFGINLLQEEPY